MKQLHLIFTFLPTFFSHKNTFRSEFRKRTLSEAVSPNLHQQHNYVFSHHHRSKRSNLDSLLDTDLEFTPLTEIQEFTASTAFRENNAGSDRSFEYMRQMLVAMACYDYSVLNPGSKCWLKEVDFRRALRDYGCNCYPSNYDSFYGRDPTVVLWQLGLNGKGVDVVDAACQNAFHRYRAFDSRKRRFF